MQTIEKEVTEFVHTQEVIEVNSANDLANAIDCLRGIKGMMDKVKSSFDPIVDQAHKAHKEAIAQRDKYLKPLQDVERKFKSAILDFNNRMEAEQREREREANERLAKQAEDERQRLLRESAKTKDVWDKEDLKEQAEAIVPITVDKLDKVVEQEGLSIRKTWKARVVDINLVPKSYLIIEPNMPALNQHARANKNFKPIPGVEFYEEASTAIKL